MDLPQIQVLDWRAKVARMYDALCAADNLATAWPQFVATKQALYTGHSAGIKTKNPDGPQFFDYNPAYALSSAFEPIGGGEAIICPCGEDGDLRLRAFAKSTDLSAALGGELTLYWLDQYGGGVFLPFRDSTNGSGTYGGGRYLFDSVKSAWLGFGPDGRMRLDFNFAYFPSCAHDPRFVCPLSPPENTLPIAIEAGEFW